ncbi:MAG: methylamine dehydrogenase accessory protein MauD [Gammaproteobacteria bacterium]|nr:methylamine dehydrogenase accessory protein MauD [Gammaproteobacteria bacterium]
MPEALLISNLLLWIAIVVLAVIVLALARQVGLLNERIAPAGALMINSVLKAGMPAPPMEVVDLNGVRRAIGGASMQRRSTLLFFLAPGCPVCKSLLPVVSSIARGEADWLEVVLASDGAESEHREFVAAQGIEPLPYVASEILGRTYGVSKLPYAVLIDEEGTISSMGIVNSREHLESLFESRERGVASIQDYLARRGEGVP